MKSAPIIKATYTAKEWDEIIDSCVAVRDTKYEAALLDKKNIVQRLQELEKSRGGI